MIRNRKSTHFRMSHVFLKQLREVSIALGSSQAVEFRQWGLV